MLSYQTSDEVRIPLIEVDSEDKMYQPPFYKEIAEFTMGGLSGYFLLKGIEEVFSLSLKEYPMTAYLTFTAAPYVYSRLIKCISDTWLSKENTEALDYYPAFSKACGSTFSAALGLGMRTFGLFSSFNNKETLLMTGIGMTGGRVMESFLESLCVKKEYIEMEEIREAQNALRII